MPYVIKGHTVYKREGGKLKKVGVSKHHIKSYVRALYANSDKRRQ